MLKNKECVKHNTPVVGMIFKLRFDVLWAAPYDMRRTDPVFCQFEQWITRLARICSTDRNPEERSRMVLEAGAKLKECIALFRETELFPSEICNRATVCLRQILAEAARLDGDEK